MEVEEDIEDGEDSYWYWWNYYRKYTRWNFINDTNIYNIIVDIDGIIDHDEESPEVTIGNDDAMDDVSGLIKSKSKNLALPVP